LARGPAGVIGFQHTIRTPETSQWLSRQPSLRSDNGAISCPLQAVYPVHRNVNVASIAIEQAIDKAGRTIMLYRSSTAAFALAAALMGAMGGAKAVDDSKYPNWKGQWSRVVIREVEGQGAFDQTKPWGPGQQAPLTAEYQKVLEESMADQAKGGLGNYPTARCLPAACHA
jgi:hypothetical protein